MPAAKVVCCLIFFVTFCLCTENTVRIQTNSSVVVFNENFPFLEYYARDSETGIVSDDAFVVDFNSLKELDIQTSTMVQEVFIGSLNYTFTVIDDSVEPTIQGGLLYTKAHQIIYHSEAVGASIIFWLFTEDQTITDLGTNRTTDVPQGILKFSMILALWPFANENNHLRLSANIKTLTEDAMTNCFLTDDGDSSIAFLTCNTDTIRGNLQLQTSATIFSYITMLPGQIQTDVTILACPTLLYDDFPIRSNMVDTICDISITELGKFPLFASSQQSYYSKDSGGACDDEDNTIPGAISQLQVILNFHNFQNAGLDYDPEISVLFDGGSSGGGSGGCKSDSYEIVKDYIFWLSIGAAIIAICFILCIIAISSTDRGYILFMGKKSVQTKMRTLRTELSKNDQRTHSFAQSSNPPML